ncbi:ABC transporter, integral membrane subunit [Leifsonia rubra CMS 76R]|nr:ABC transporter, integral membrane subunit [Leifsonia rubra CMS 76R]
MTDTTLNTRRSSPSHRTTGLSFPRVVRSEWIKLRTLRSTQWSFVIFVLLTMGFGLLLAATFDDANGPPLDLAGQKSFAVTVATLGVNFTQLVVAVLGVLIISGEYTTGMIRSTFAAVPTRLPAVFAKALVLAVATFVFSLVSILATALVAIPLLSSKGIDSQLQDGEVMRALVGGTGYLTLIALLAFAFGTILRSSAGGIASVLGLILVIPPVLTIISGLTQATWVHNVSVFLPSDAGSQMFAVGDVSLGGGPPLGGSAQDLLTLDATQGFLVLLGWVVVLLATATILVKRRDA